MLFSVFSKLLKEFSSFFISYIDQGTGSNLLDAFSHCNPQIQPQSSVFLPWTEPPLKETKQALGSCFFPWILGPCSIFENIVNSVTYE